MTLISVIIPVYNSEKYLVECLDSVINQSFKDYEVICVDDGSTDSSLEILESYSRDHSFIKVISQPNLYAGAARNTGIEAARGEWLTFLDSDDSLDHDALQRLYTAAVSTGSDVVRAKGYYLNSDDEKAVVDWSLRDGIIEDGDSFKWSDISQDIFNISAGNPWGMIVRKKVVDDYSIRFFTLPRTEDIAFTYYSYLRASKITVIYDQLVFHRQSEGGMENTKVKHPLVPLEARHQLESMCKKDGFYDSVYKGFWVTGFRSYLQMILLLSSGDQKKDAKLYYDDIFRILSLHPDIDLKNDKILRARSSDFYKKYETLVESKDFDSYWEEITRPRREMEERLRLKEEKDAIERDVAINSREPSTESIKFSVVIPVYNATAYIRECLDHIVYQSYSNVEIICVDDGSTDDSRELIEKEYPDVKLICQNNSGAGIARNNGFEHCSGDYVLFMDSDDWIEYNLFRRMRDVITSSNYPEVVLYSHERFDQVYAVSEKHSVLKDYNGIWVSNLEKSPDFFLNNDFVVPWNKVL